MEPGHSRLVVEIPTETYDKLEELQRTSGKYKKAIVTDLVNRAFGHHLKALERIRKNTEETT